MCSGCDIGSAITVAPPYLAEQVIEEMDYDGRPDRTRCASCLAEHKREHRQHDTRDNDLDRAHAVTQKQGHVERGESDRDEDIRLPESQHACQTDQQETAQGKQFSVAPQANESAAHATVSAPTPTSASADAQLENAVPIATDVPAPTPPAAQMVHLVAIRERLDARERAIAEAAIHKMTPEQLAHWLGELSEQSVDDATTMIRDLIAQIRQNTPTRNP